MNTSGNQHDESNGTLYHRDWKHPGITLSSDPSFSLHQIYLGRSYINADVEARMLNGLPYMSE